LTDLAPLIVSALFAPDDFAWLDGLRRAHFPPERNVLSAHLTLFHHLPPSVEGELRQRMTQATRGRPAPPARAERLRNLGRGVAIAIVSPELEAIREDLAAAFARELTPQDAAGWRPHVTIQNKVMPDAARALLSQLEPFAPRPIRLSGLALWRYRGGPWEAVSRHPFG
jgi:2'-5' RNA ligase